VDNSALGRASFFFNRPEHSQAGYNHLHRRSLFRRPGENSSFHPERPEFFVGYQWTRNRNDSIGSALMPTLAQREGDVSPTVTIPKSLISPQALALLKLYPLPNFSTPGAYNYQVPLVSVTHQDSLNSRWNQSIDRKNQVFGNFAFQDTRQDNPNVFGFLDTTDTFGLTTSANWFHRFAQGFFGTFGYQFSRLSIDVKPYFENRDNISGAAGIAGNDQSPVDWGPPTLIFSSGIQSLSDSEQALNHNETGAVSSSFSLESRAPQFPVRRRLQEAAVQCARPANGRGNVYVYRRRQRLGFRRFSVGRSRRGRRRVRQCRQIFSRVVVRRFFQRRLAY
jgi:hypothetical protein